ncbi:hypothetical protein SALBM311S_01726 [Streptomyces alboniger]
MGLTMRVEKRIAKDFPGRDGRVVGELLAELVHHLTERGDREDKERIAAATLLCGRGRVDRLLDAVQLAKEDWRDVLVGAGLADAGWREQLEVDFGPGDAPSAARRVVTPGRGLRCAARMRARVQVRERMRAAGAARTIDAQGVRFYGPSEVLIGDRYAEQTEPYSPHQEAPRDPHLPNPPNHPNHPPFPKSRSPRRPRRRPARPDPELGVRIPQPRRVTGDVVVHDPTTIRNSAGRYLLYGTGGGLGYKTSTDRIAFTNGGDAFGGKPGWWSSYASEAWAPHLVPGRQVPDVLRPRPSARTSRPSDWRLRAPGCRVPGATRAPSTPPPPRATTTPSTRTSS